MPRIQTLIAILLVCCFGPTSAQTVPTSSAGDEVTLVVSVSDAYGRAVKGLKQEQFKIREGKNFHEVSSFSSDDEPVSVGLLFHTSGSGVDYLLHEAFNSLPGFMKAANGETEFLIMAFDKETRVLVEWKSSGAHVLQALRGVTIKQRGATALFDSIDNGVAKVGTGRHARKALIVFTDGVDSESRLSFTNLKDRLRSMDVLVYGVDISTGEEPPFPAPSLSSARSLLEELTAVTGGEFFSVRPSDATARIAAELRSLYRIGFRPKAVTTGQKSETWREVDVKLDLPPKVGKLKVRTRRGYKLGQSGT